MNFDLKRPCPKCPFRRDCQKGWLGRARAQEIADSVLKGDLTFACHETVLFDDDGEHVKSEVEQHCAGAIILVEDKERAANQMLQIAERLGLRDPDQIDPKAKALIFNSGVEFVKHHDDPRRR